MPRTWAGRRRKKNWYENQKLPLKGISRIQRRLSSVSNPESRGTEKNWWNSFSRGEEGGSFFRATDWKISFNLKSIRLFAPTRGGTFLLPAGRGCFNKARILSSIIEERNSVSFRREARKLSSPSKKLFFCSADRGFFFDNLSRGWGGMPWNSLNSYTGSSKEPSLSLEGTEGLSSQLIWMSLSSDIKSTRPIWPPRNQIFFVFPSIWASSLNSSRSSTFYLLNAWRRGEFAREEEKENVNFR